MGCNQDFYSFTDCAYRPEQETVVLIKVPRADVQKNLIALFCLLLTFCECLESELGTFLGGHILSTC